MPHRTANRIAVALLATVVLLALFAFPRLGLAENQPVESTISRGSGATVTADKRAKIQMSAPVTTTVTFNVGWNDFALALEPTLPYTAETLCQTLNSGGANIADIYRWDGGGWQGHPCGVPVNDFPVELGLGYLVRSNSTSTVTLEGTRRWDDVTHTIQVGWNAFSLPHTSAYVAEDVCTEFSAAGVPITEVRRWFAGGWDSHPCGIPINNFTIERGEGYFVKASNSGSVQIALPMVDHCGNISADETWQGGVVHRLTCSVTVQSGVTLTVDADAVVKLTGSISVQGTLEAEGTASEPIYITSIKDDSVGGDTNGDGNSSTPAPGNWHQVFVSSGATASFAYTKLRYGGYTSSSSYDAIIEAKGDSQLTLSHSEVRFSGKYGISIDDGSSSTTSNNQLTIDQSIISNNDAYGIRMNGTHNDANHLTLTDSAVSDNGGYGVYFNGALDPIITGSTFEGNTSDQIRLSYSTNSSLGTIDDNNGTSTSNNSIYLSGTITGTSVLHNNTGLVFEPLLTVDEASSLTIEPGVVLKNPYLYVKGTLDAQGTASEPIYFTSIKDDSVGGDTNGDGNSSSPAPGDWSQVFVSSGASASFAHAKLRYGGYNSSSPYDAIIEASSDTQLTLSHSEVSYSGTYGITIDDGSSSTTSNNQLTIDQSIISNNDAYGIRMNGTHNDANHLTLTDSAVSDNGGYGVYVSNPVNSHVQGSNLFGNGNYGIYSLGGTINARNNWWGSASGPAPFGSGNGINYSTCTDPSSGLTYYCNFYVDVAPWIGYQQVYGAQQGTNGALSRVQAFEGDPVNTATGSYYYNRTDIAIPTMGLSLDFSRGYNALDPQDGPLGWGWTHNWHIALTEDTASDEVYVAFGDGHLEFWTWTGSSYEGAAGIFGTLVKHDNGTFDLTQTDQTQYHFDADGKLLWAADHNGNQTTLAYDGQDRLTTVTEPTGRSLSFGYSSPISSSLISSVTDPAGRIVNFTYDANGDLVTVTDVTGAATSRTYDANHRILTTTDANSHTFISNQYDAQGRVFRQHDGDGNEWNFAYYEPTHTTIVTDPLGRQTTYVYDEEWRLIQEKDALSKSLFYSYDSDHNRTSATDKRGNQATFGFDERGNMLTIVDTAGFTTTLSYDGSNNLLSSINPRGATTSYSYDANHNLTSLTDALGNSASWVYSGQGLLVSATDALGNVSSYTYDALGYPASMTDALGNSSTTNYDNVGRLLSEADALGRSTSYTYDAANRLLSVTAPLGQQRSYSYDAVGNQISSTDPNGNSTTFAYDVKDRLSSETDALGNVTSYTYDAVDNQVSMTNGAGETTTFNYDALNRQTATVSPLGHTTSYSYDADGNRTSMTDANGNTTSYSYDGRNLLTSVTDALGGVVSYSYDEVGNRTSMSDANGHSTSYSYDLLDRMVASSDPLGNSSSYAFDANGNRSSYTKPDGTLISYGYDALDRLTTTSYGSETITFGYDAVSNRTSMSDPLGTTSYSYDDLDRILQVVVPNGTLGYSYDLAGNRTAVSYPGSQTATYSYDGLNRLTTVTDWNAASTSYSYDGASRQTAIGYPNGVTASYSYDGDGRLLSLAHTSPISGTIALATYTLDATGNRLSMQATSGTSSYAYDDLHRLTNVTYPDGETVNYSYDAMGNRSAMTSSVSGSTSYSYDAADRLLDITDGGGTTTLSWDANGDLLSKGSTSYSFDELGRLVQVDDGTTVTSYAYDGDGVRQQMVVGGVATDYLQDVVAPLPIVLRESSGGQASDYLYGNDLVAQLDGVGRVSYYHTDGLGSTTALSDATGASTASYSYDVFGATRTMTGSNGQPFTYAGEQVDTATGLVYLRARYYDPAVGRLISSDPWPGRAWEPQTTNGYVYALNNPLINLDPSGAIVEKLAEKGGNVVYNVRHFDEYTHYMKLALADPIARGFVLDELSENSDIVGQGSCAVGFGPGCTIFTTASDLIDIGNGLDTARGIAQGEVPSEVGVDRAISMGVGLGVGKLTKKYISGPTGESAWRYGTRYGGTIFGGRAGRFVSHGTKVVLKLGGFNSYITDPLSQFALDFIGGAAVSRPPSKMK